MALFEAALDMGEFGEGGVHFGIVGITGGVGVGECASLQVGYVGRIGRLVGPRHRWQSCSPSETTL